MNYYFFSFRQADFRLMHWLNVQEDTFPLVIYECDNMATNWTRRCLRQADAILLVANGQQKPMKQSFVRLFGHLFLRMVIYIDFSVTHISADQIYVYFFLKFRRFD